MQNLSKKNKLIVAAGIILLLFLILIIHPSNTYAQIADDSNNTENSAADKLNELDNLIDEQKNSSGIGVIEEELEKYTDEGLSEIIEDFDSSSLIRDLTTGKLDISPNKLINGILNALLKEVYSNANIIIKFMIAAMLCALIRNLQTSFMKEGVGELAFYVSYIIIVSIMAVSFSEVLKIGTEIIGNMLDFMYATMPVLVTLMVSNGNIVSGGIMQPLILLVVETSANVFSKVFIPLTSMSAAVSIVNHISNQIKLTRLAELMKKICNWGIGLFLTVFAAFIAIKGSVGAVVDGVAAKSLKFTIGSIPVVGKYISDAAETVLGCTLLLKNAGGVAVIIGLVGITLFPLLKMGAVIVMYKLAGSLIEPISDKRISDCTDDVTKAMSAVFGIVAAVIVMFIIAVAAVVGVSNLSTMVR